MIELSLESGATVSFDGRVLEIFALPAIRGRYHVAELAEPSVASGADRSTAVRFAGWSAPLEFAPAEAAACARLLALISEAQQAYRRDLLSLRALL